MYKRQEHISTEGYSEKLGKITQELLGEIGKLIASAEDGLLRKEGIRTVIVGKPNAGKSSLLDVYKRQVYGNSLDL